MIIKPMLAINASDCLDDLTYPLLASHKLDGIRCIMTDEGPRTRSGEEIPNLHVRTLLEGLPPGPDGELVCLDANGVPDFRKTTGDLRRLKGEPVFRYMVFDNWKHPGPFWMRHRSVEGWRDRPHWVRTLAQIPVMTAGEVRALFAAALEAGQEGLVLRDMLGEYKHGRSTLRSQGMLKVKPYEDAEGVIVGWTERMHNTNDLQRGALGQSKRRDTKADKAGTGMVGSFVVSSKYWPREFEVGAGAFTHKELASMMKDPGRLIGKVLKFKYVKVGGYDVPRHGTALGFREAWDMDAPYPHALKDSP